MDENLKLNHFIKVISRYNLSQDKYDTSDRYLFKAMMVLHTLDDKGYKSLSDVFIGCAAINVVQKYTHKKNCDIGPSYLSFLYEICSFIYEDETDASAYYAIQNGSRYVYITIKGYQFRFNVGKNKELRYKAKRNDNVVFDNVYKTNYSIFLFNKTIEELAPNSLYYLVEKMENSDFSEYSINNNHLEYDDSYIDISYYQMDKYEYEQKQTSEVGLVKEIHNQSEETNIIEENEDVKTPIDSKEDDNTLVETEVVDITLENDVTPLMKENIPDDDPSLKLSFKLNNFYLLLHKFCSKEFKETQTIITGNTEYVYFVTETAGKRLALYKFIKKLGSNDIKIYSLKVFDFLHDLYEFTLVEKYVNTKPKVRKSFLSFAYSYNQKQDQSSDTQHLQLLLSEFENYGFYFETQYINYENLALYITYQNSLELKIYKENDEWMCGVVVSNSNTLISNKSILLYEIDSYENFITFFSKCYFKLEEKINNSIVEEIEDSYESISSVQDYEEKINNSIVEEIENSYETISSVQDYEGIVNNSAIEEVVDKNDNVVSELTNIFFIACDKFINNDADIDSVRLFEEYKDVEEKDKDTEVYENIIINLLRTTLESNPYLSNDVYQQMLSVEQKNKYQDHPVIKQYLSRFSDWKIDEPLLKNKLRSIYYCGEFNKPFSKQDVDLEHINFLDNFLKIIQSTGGIELDKYLRSQPILTEKIDGYMVSRIAGNPHRLIYKFGKDFKNLSSSYNKEDVFLFAYWCKHPKENTNEYSRILKRLKNVSEQYSNKWKSYIIHANKKEKNIVPIKEQDTIIQSEAYPIVIMGCPGSGKTIMATKKYVHILKEDYLNRNLDCKKDDLIFLTYSDYIASDCRKLIMRFLLEENLPNNIAIRVYTINEIFLKLLKFKNIESNQIVQEEDFRKWFSINYLHSKTNKVLGKLKKTNLTDLEFVIWTYFRGVYRGSRCGWEKEGNVYKTRLDKKTLTLAEFKNFLSQKEDLLGSDTDFVYEVCEKFQKYLNENNLYDDNDLALFIMEKLNDNPFYYLPYKNLIVDEVQDLTETQLEAIVRLTSKEMKMSFFGDANQSVNPTIFKMERIRSCINFVMNENINWNNTEEYLYKTMRIPENFIPYINHLIDVRESIFGLNHDYNRRLEHLPINTGEDKEVRSYGLVNNRETFEKALPELVSLYSKLDCYILFSSQKDIDEFKDRYNDINISADRLLTVCDVKGLEAEIIITYNLVKSNEGSFSIMHSDKSIKDKRDNVVTYRMIFNRLNVANTRFKKALIVFEDSLNNEIEEWIYPSDIIPRFNDPLSMIANLKLEMTEVEYFSLGNSNFQSHQYAIAMKYFNKCSNDDAKLRAEACNLLINRASPVELVNFAKSCDDADIYREVRWNIKGNVLEHLMTAYIGETKRGIERGNITIDVIKEIINTYDISEKDNEVLMNLHCLKVLYKKFQNSYHKIIGKELVMKAVELIRVDELFAEISEKLKEQQKQIDQLKKEKESLTHKINELESKSRKFIRKEDIPLLIKEETKNLRENKVEVKIQPKKENAQEIIPKNKAGGAMPQNQKVIKK